MGYIGYPPTKRRVLLEVAACHGCTIHCGGPTHAVVEKGDVMVSVSDPNKAAETLGLGRQYASALFAFGVYDTRWNVNGRHGR